MTMEARFNLINTLMERFKEGIISTTTFRGDLTVAIKPALLPALLSYLKTEKGFNFLMDICGIHYPERSEPLEVVYHLLAFERRERIRIKVPLQEDQAVPTAASIYKAANWFEREAFDMVGIRFDGHPNLTRILTHHEFVGHPLRKDYPSDKNQILRKPLEFHLSKDADAEIEDPVLHQRRFINIGPSHPATHGAFRLFAELEGEVIKKARAEIGYLHRCFEKMAETHTYHQVIPYTDRLNYCSSPMNNAGYCRAVEKLLGIEIPKRAQYMRVILNELSRIIDHLVCIGAQSVDVGALTNFWYFFQGRELVYELFESYCGARMLVNVTRIGGMVRDFPEDWLDNCLNVVGRIEKTVLEVNRILTNNKIWVHRTKGVGVVSKADAIDYGFTGPCLRACGVAFDLRKTEPYYDYDQFDFDIPISEDGDTYARYLVRMEEMLQSISLVRQVVKAMPKGPYAVDSPDITLPPKQEVYTNIEALMNHFKLVMHGIQPPKGDVYSSTEAANGELGFYIVSDGSKNPYRIKVRPPCFAIYQAVEEVVEGSTISDLVAMLGSLNIIAGELDR